MASLVQVLRDEINKAVKRETRSVLQAVEKDNSELKAAVKRLEAQVAAQGKSGSAGTGLHAKSIAGDASPVRFSSSSLRTFRHGLGLSQREMAILCGVSSQAVYLWECKGGPLRLRNDTRRKLLGLQKMGKKQIKTLLAKAYQ